METLKSVIGLGKKEPSEDSGQEPVSGAQGEGTATQPYDAGNSEEATNAAEQEGQEPVSGVQGEGTPTQPYDAGDSEEATNTAEQVDQGKESATRHGQSQSLAPNDQQEPEAQPTSTSKSEHSTPSQDDPSEKKHAIGSPGWFKSAKPSSTKDQSGNSSTAERTGTSEIQKPEDSISPVGEQQSRKSEVGGTGWLKSADPFDKESGSDRKESLTARPKRENAEPEAKESDLAPNQLGEHVPLGQSADIAAPGDPAPGKVDDMESSPSNNGIAKENTPIQPRNTDDNITPAPPVDPATEGTNEDGAETSATHDRQRAQVGVAPRERNSIAGNPSAIPVAGGVPLGKSITEERLLDKEREREVDTVESMPKLDKEGSPDDQTAKNTAANASNASKTGALSVAPPAYNEVDNNDNLDSAVGPPSKTEKVKAKLSSFKDKIKPRSSNSDD